MVPAVFLENQFHHVVFEVVGKINVDVGEFVESHPLFVEKSPEIKVKPNRTDATDSKTIADKAVGGAPACDPLNAPCPAILEKVPGDEKIFPRNRPRQ